MDIKSITMSRRCITPPIHFLPTGDTIISKMKHIEFFPPSFNDDRNTKSEQRSSIKKRQKGCYLDNV